MLLAKPRLDIGLSTNSARDQESFWGEVAGLAREERLEISPSQVQHRFDANGSVLKVNVFADPLSRRAGGYQEILLARDGLAEPKFLRDPDGTRVTLVPSGYKGIRQLAIRLAVRSLSEHRLFLTETMGLPEIAPGRFRAGETLILVEEDPAGLARAAQHPAGWRYITFQVPNVETAHARALAGGASEASAPVRLGDIARFSIVRDPDGNAIELSQRASIVGSLD